MMSVTFGFTISVQRVVSVALGTRSAQERNAVPCGAIPFGTWTVRYFYTLLFVQAHKFSHDRYFKWSVR